jgi:argininosuccinate lyase
VVGKSVRYCIENGKFLTDLSLEEFRQFSPLFAADIQDAIRVETCVANRNSYGGTSYQQVELAIKSARQTVISEQEKARMFNPAEQTEL